MTIGESTDRLPGMTGMIGWAPPRRPAAPRPPRRPLSRRSGDIDLATLLRLLATDGQLVDVTRLPTRPARHGTLRLDLPERVWAGLWRLGIDSLWSHQAEAIDLVRTGESVVVATGTASGKSLCYQAPIAEAATDPTRPGTALLVFPTKALAHDQLGPLTGLGLDGLVPAAYDGDSTTDERTWARRHANVVLTNPEMLHCALLPHHGRWATFLMRLRYVVVDELHSFRGVFGTHLAHLLRRLRRVCAHYGSSPTFVFGSATIGRPAVLASGLCALPVTEVVDDGSPRGERIVALWNPPLLAPACELDAELDADAGSDHGDGRGGGDAAVAPSEDGLAPSPTGPLRRSAHGETAGLVAELVADDRRTIAFCRSRRATEVVAADVRRRLPIERADLVRPYRGGYLPEERRQIEDELFGGRLDGVITTNALELGVDIGGLDACVLDGFPGTIASFWQQAGRAGRQQQESLAVLVAGEDQLDQWLMSHPAELHTRPPEPAVINPANPFVLIPHLACAAFELPLTHDDERYWPDLLDDGVRELVRQDALKIRRPAGRRTGPAAVWAGRGFPARGVGLRSGSANEFQIVRADGTPVGTIDEGRAFEMVHPGATYLHQGQVYRVVDLDLHDRAALVEECDDDTYTMARTHTSIAIVRVDAARTVGRAGLRLGEVEVTTQVIGYERRHAITKEVVAREPLDLPPSTLATRAFWYVTEPEVLVDAGVAPANWPGALHAAEHAGIGILPLFTICDRWDVGGVSTVHLADTGGPTIVIYDAYAGGAGIAELGFEASDRHLGATLEVIEGCGCSAGCPSCVQSPKCGNGNEPLDKRGAIAVLRTVLG
jgi:DEAD/DEAH box helicase domain-containing protein